jgi:glycosyltransferase involved in cell wall biosynthesis
MSLRRTPLRANRILHIQKAGGIAGAERHLLTLLEHLDRTHFTFEFLLLVERDEHVKEYKSRLEGIGVPTRTIPIKRNLDPVCLWQIMRFIRRGAYDVVHTHLVHGDLYGTVAAKLAGVSRVLSSKHGYNDFENSSRAYLINGVLQRYIDAVITISDALQEKVYRFEGIPKEKMRTIHYGLEPSAAPPRTRERIRAELEIPPDQFLVASAGRFVNFKGLKYLIRAAARLQERVPNVTVVIAGDGPLRVDLESEIRFHNVTSTVQLLGWRSDVSDIMAAADVFVLPSLGEGFGLVLLEAMSQRLAVIGTRSMSIPEIVLDGVTGFLVDPADEGHLASAIEAVARNPALRRQMGEAGYERVRSEFSVSAMVKKTEQLYLELTGVV